MKPSIGKLVLLSCMLTGVCLGYSLGPPLGACVDMWPTGHGYDAQDSYTPYTITVSKYTYSPGETLTVVVNTTITDEIAFFEGMLLQARRASCSHKQVREAVGSFSLSAGEDFLGLMNCQGGQNSSVGHIAHAHIVDRTFTWTAPPTSVGNIYFRATVARRKSTFWTQVKSEFIRDASDSSTPEFCPVQTKMTTTCTGASNYWQLSRGLLLIAMLICFWRHL